MTTFQLLLYFMIVSFLYFGIACIFTPRMRLEFTRFGLNTIQRLIAGFFQLLGATGLIAGALGYDTIGMAASAGLAILMLAGFYVRIKIKDDIYKSSPALIFMCLSLILCYKFYKFL
jgi:uncharacterized membrane protein